jgi:hypothetical protein
MFPFRKKLLLPGKKQLVPNSVRRASLLGAPFVLLGAGKAAADTAFANFAFRATGGSTDRTMPDRLGEIFNVKDYGAKGNNVADDTTAIRATVAAMYSTSTRCGTVYFPHRTYKVTGTIDLSAKFPFAGRIAGAGMGASRIVGNINNDFILSLPAERNGVQEISDLYIENSSTVIGTGAIRYLQVAGVLRNLHLKGMVCIDSRADSVRFHA